MRKKEENVLIPYGLCPNNKSHLTRRSQSIDIIAFSNIQNVAKDEWKIYEEVVIPGVETGTRVKDAPIKKYFIR